MYSYQYFTLFKGLLTCIIFNVANEFLLWIENYLSGKNGYKFTMQPVEQLEHRWVIVMSTKQTEEEQDKLIKVINMDGKILTPCLPHRAWREVERARAVWIDEETIKLLYNPFLFRDYRKAALKRDRHTCLWCGRPATTVDHIIPSSKGGSDLPANLLASCSECNTRRGNRSAFSYLKENTQSIPNIPKLYWRIFIAICRQRLK